ncbi:MAG: bifunctional oligoribonuclease/PAP phosphatase NrnA [Sporomusaceae bacterium]|jgi:phosphoesterase RecJ-like protein|nr:bifunctional oligoribonuclease/PAP phosphatase NrnA [Sporomusaceae bacterium]
MQIFLRDITPILRQHQNIVITTHVNPDGDAIGSALALYFYLVALGKKARLVIDDDIPPYLKFLPGSHFIAKADAALDAIAEASLIIVLDASDQGRYGKVVNPTAKILNIDHHLSNTKFAEYWYVDETAAATGEIIFQFLQNEKAVVTEEMATCLFTSLATDCGFFQFANTTAATLRYAAQLVEYGAKPNAISEFLTVKPLKNVQILPKVLTTLTIFKTAANITVASLTLQKEVLAELESDTEDFAKYPRNITGVDIAVVYKEIEETCIKISMRSKDINVSQIALHFGGGGHLRAAGCTIKGTLDFAKTELLAAIERYTTA